MNFFIGIKSQKSESTRKSQQCDVMFSTVENTSAVATHSKTSEKMSFSQKAFDRIGLGGLALMHAIVGVDVMFYTVPNGKGEFFNPNARTKDKKGRKVSAGVLTEQLEELGLIPKDRKTGAKTSFNLKVEESDVKSVNDLIGKINAEIKTKNETATEKQEEYSLLDEESNFEITATYKLVASDNQDDEEDEDDDEVEIASVDAKADGVLAPVADDWEV